METSDRPRGSEEVRTPVLLSPLTEANSEAEVAAGIAEMPPYQKGPGVRGIGPSSDKENQAPFMTGQVPAERVEMGARCHSTGKLETMIAQTRSMATEGQVVFTKSQRYNIM